jgi:hypothetical protein
MSLLANPVPTSGEIRALRRRLGEHVASLTLVTNSDTAVPVVPVDADDDPHGLGWFYNSRQAAHLLAGPRARRVLHAVAVAGTAGLDTLEQVSDDTHDTVEETLARLSGWPRTLFERARPLGPRDHHEASPAAAVAEVGQERA